MAAFRNVHCSDLGRSFAVEGSTGAISGLFRADFENRPEPLTPAEGPGLPPPHTPLDHPGRQQGGQLIFELGPEIPPLAVSSRYSVVELRRGAWVYYRGAVADEPVQRFLGTPLPEHSLEALARWIEADPRQDGDVP